MHNFISNKYTKWYFNIISAAKSRNLSEYTEQHHIIPKSLGGDNSLVNLVKLTPREHFICHWLLTKMTINNDRYKMNYALNGMKRKGKCKERYRNKITSRIYSKLRPEINKQISDSAKGLAPAKDAHTGERLGKISTDDPRWATGEIVGQTKGSTGTMNGKHTAKIKSTNEILGIIPTNDPRWATGEIVSINYGTVFTDLHKKNISDSRKAGIANGTIVPWNSGLKTGPNSLGGTATAKCSITGEILGRISQDDPRWLTGQIVGVRKS